MDTPVQLRYRRTPTGYFAYFVPFSIRVTSKNFPEAQFAMLSAAEFSRRAPHPLRPQFVVALEDADRGTLLQNGLAHSGNNVTDLQVAYVARVNGIFY